MFENHTNKEILEVLREIERLLKHALSRPRSATLTIIDLDTGEDEMVTIAVGGAGAKAVYQEFDGPNGTGNAVKPVGTVSFASDNPAVASVDQSGNITAVSPGTATITANDSGAPTVPPASDSVTVVAGQSGVPVSATLVITAN